MNESLPLDSDLEDEAIERLVHLHSGRASAADRLAFHNWRQLSPAHHAAARDAEALWGALPHTATAQRHDMAEPTGIPPRRWRGGAAIAASLAMIALTLGLYHQGPALYADHSTTTGERREIHLADGSQVWLNSGTALSVDFSDARRDIRLYRGEALFAVAKDSTRPFVVHAAEGEVRAVGTRFDVDLRDHQVEVRVSEGVVQVDSAGAPPARLTIGQGLHYQQGQAPGAVHEVDLRAADAWQRGKLIFNRQPLGEVLGELERYLPGKLYLTDDTLRAQLVSGVFELDDPQGMLDTLAQTQPVQITRLPLLTLVRPKS
ncbi:FecR family protein [Pseudomonas sp. Marseille-Q8238]